MLNYICYGLDPKTAELVLGTVFAFHPDDPDPDESLKREIALVHVHGIPLIAETPERQARVDALLREAMTTGFSLDDGRGPRRFRYTPYEAPVDFNSLRGVASLLELPAPSASEMRLIVQELRGELEARTEAGRVLAALRLAIDELKRALQADTANEHELQRVLTAHPILFGPEYVSVRPQHPLGKDYVMDYALVRSSGQADLVEIEASTHPLYTRADNPSAKLVHAEQQVLDWLASVAQHANYFQRSLPELQQPIGFVVIGRSTALTVAQREKLRQRNQVLRSTLLILTYDDLLDRAKSLLRTLDGLGR